jgi:hypothetical protein
MGFFLRFKLQALVKKSNQLLNCLLTTFDWQRRSTLQLSRMKGRLNCEL